MDKFDILPTQDGVIILYCKNCFWDKSLYSLELADLIKMAEEHECPE